MTGKNNQKAAKEAIYLATQLGMGLSSKGVGYTHSIEPEVQEPEAPQEQELDCEVINIRQEVFKPSAGLEAKIKAAAGNDYILVKVDGREFFKYDDMWYTRHKDVWYTFKGDMVLDEDFAKELDSAKAEYNAATAVGAAACFFNGRYSTPLTTMKEPEGA